MPSTVGIVASGEDVLNDAVFWVDAGRSSVVSGALSNLGTGGSALDARFGSTSGTDSFDPQLLTHTGTNYLYLPGINSANSVSSPSSTALNVTGDLELEVIFQTPPDWTVAATSSNPLLSKQATGQRSYCLRRIASGTGLQFVWTVDGSTVLSASVATSVPAGTNAVKVTHDVDNGASQNAVAFYTSTNYGATYTQLGSTQLAAGVTSHFAGTASLVVGGDPISGLLEAAGYRRAIVRDGIGGTAVFDADFTTGITSGAQATFTESSANAATVTINRSTSGRKSVAVVRNVLSFGTDDYLEVADSDLLDFAASDSFTVMAVVRQWATPTNFGRIIDKALVSSTGWSMSNSGTASGLYGGISDGTNSASRSNLSTYTLGALRLSAIRVDRSAQTLLTYTNNTASTTTSTSSVGSIANALPMRIGRMGDTGTGYQDMELVAAAVWRRALNTNEIATLTARYT